MAENRFEYVRELIERGDLGGAVNSLVSNLQSNSRDVDAWLLLAEVMEDPARKKDCYQQVLKWSPGNSAALKGLEKLEASEPGHVENSPSHRPDQEPGGKAPVKVSVHDELFHTLNQKETNEFVQIWENNDRSQGSDAAFDMIRDILQARLGNLPPRKQSSFFSNRNGQFRIMRLGCSGFFF